MHLCAGSPRARARARVAQDSDSSAPKLQSLVSVAKKLRSLFESSKDAAAARWGDGKQRLSGGWVPLIWKNLPPCTSDIQS